MAADILNLRTALWPGFTDATILESGDRRFRQLVNCYIGNEGTEIRRFPGFRPAAIPNFEIQHVDSTNEMEIASYPDSEGPMIVTLAGRHMQDDGMPGYAVIWGTKFKPDGQGTSLIPRIDSVAPILPRSGFDGIYEIVFINNTAKTLKSFQIVGGIAASTAGSVGGSTDPAGKVAFFQKTGVGQDKEPPLYVLFTAWNKLRIPHALASIRDRLILIGESDYRRTKFMDDVGVVVEYLKSYTGTSGSPLISTITVQIDALQPAVNYLPIQNEYVLFENVTGAGLAALNGKTLRVESAIATFTPGSPATVVFTVDTGGVAIAAGTHTQTAPARASMVRVPHSDSFSMTAYTLLNRPDINNPQLVSARAALVANTQRDWGGRFGFLWAEGYIGRTKRRVKQIPRRVSVDVAADRILLGAPGYGVAFQVPAVVPVTDSGSAGVVFHFNSNFDKPRCSGVPKAVIHEVVPTLVNGKTVTTDEAGVVSSNNLVGASAGNLANTPISPTTLVATVVTATGTNVMRDGGSGTFTQISGPDTISAATINYSTGAVSIDMSANVTSGSFTYNDDTAVNGFQTKWTPDGTYRIKVANKDDYTGEIGLASDEAIAVVAGSSAANKVFLQIHYLHPGYLVSESLPSSVNIYVSIGAGGDFGLARNVKIPPFGTEPPYYIGTPSHVLALVLVNLFNFDPTEVDALDFTQQPPAIPLMPMGCKAIRTIGPYTFYGGSHGDRGQRGEIQRGGLTAQFDDVNVTTGNPVTESNHRRRDQFAVRLFDHLAAPLDDPFNMAAAGIPPGYGGRKIFTRELLTDDVATPAWPSSATQLGGTFPPGPLLDKHVAINGPKTLHHGFLNLYPDPAVTGPEWPESWWPRWKMKDYRFIPKHTYAATNEECFLMLPRGQIWFSEAGKPGEIAGINALPVDTIGEEDVEAIGRLGNRAIICTRSQTYGFEWGNNPRGSYVRTMSTSHGAIAPNTMAENDMGLGWMSERGPMLLGQGFQWIGRHVQESFIGISPRYLRDEQGMMLHAWACHDPERSLVYFGLRTNRLEYTLTDQGPNSTFTTVTWETASEDQKTKFPCDEILCYSYVADAWSVWRPRMNIHWMTRIMCADGVYRIVFLGEDLIIYALDEAAQDTNFEPVKATASLAGSFATSFIAAAPFANLTSGSGKYVNNTCVAQGMVVAVYEAGTLRLLGTSTIAATPSDDAASVTLSSPITWAVGDVIQIGLIDMEVETTKLALAGITDPAKVTAVSLRGHFYSRLSADATVVVGYSGTNPPLCWGSMQLDSERYTNAQLDPNGYKLIRDEAGVSTPGVPMAVQWNRGANRGHNMSVKFRAIGGQQLRINNLALMLEEAGK